MKLARLSRKGWNYQWNTWTTWDFNGGFTVKFYHTYIHWELYGKIPNIEYEEKLYVPTRFIAENLGIKVNCNGNNGAININQKK